jgi:uncharacterized protein YyaL (SSP411 family)
MPNRLIHESSPYLLQHAHNPVDWYPWGPEALEKAKREDKPILVSIGYAACHWCHVMEHESFENQEVAETMNAHFVCIKVDREERPDIDKVYMDAVTIMTGRGGWPLNCFALPDGRPFFGGTYFPKENWLKILGQIDQLYKKERGRTLEYADNLVSAMDSMNQLVAVSEDKPFTVAELETMIADWLEQIDFKFGGRRVSANKFPLPANNLFLLRAAHFLRNQRLQEAVDISLVRMAYGGIYDHLGGGFARYSVDPYWKVPHFEKMLYDNSQLVSLYAEAWQKDQNPLYRHVVEQTLGFIEREMTSAEGGFFSSLDADSEGVEGKFYTWSEEEIRDALGEEADDFIAYYQVEANGNWEHTNVLFISETEAEFAVKKGLQPEDFSNRMEIARRKLMERRDNRIRPGLDDKILTSWNALMIKAYADAYRVLGKQEYLDAALRNAAFISGRLTDNGRLFRNYKEGKATISGFLDDYAHLIEAYLCLYQLTFDIQWVHKADRHMEYVLEHFSDPKTGMCFYTSDLDEALASRTYETQDNVIPASNSVLAHCLHTLGLLLYKPAYSDRAERMLRQMHENLIKMPAWHANWGLLMLKRMFPFYEVVIAGSEAAGYRMAFEQIYGPDRLFAGSTDAENLPLLEGRLSEKTMIYICQENTCKLPVSTVSEGLSQMKG